MNRPLISDFFPESFTPKDLNKVFLANPELYRYIQALDGYVDLLEDKPEDNLVIKTACDLCNGTGIIQPDFPFIHNPCPKCFDLR